MEPRPAESGSIGHLYGEIRHEAKVLPAMGLTSLGCSDVMPETKLELFQYQLLSNLFEPGELHPGQALHLTIAQKFVVGFADNDNAALPGNKRTVDKVLRRG